MNLQEKTIECYDCGTTFVFSIEEQQDYLAKGRRHAPKRCSECREKRKARQQKDSNTALFGQFETREERKMYTVTCSECGKRPQVPFEPKSGRPVFCRNCYNRRKVKSQTA